MTPEDEALHALELDEVIRAQRVHLDGLERMRARLPISARVEQAAAAAGIPNPREAERRVYMFESSLVRCRLCAQGDLVKHLTKKFGELWRQQDIKAVEAECRAFERDRRAAVNGSGKSHT